MADISLIIDVESKEVSRAVDELVRMRTAAKDTGKAFEQGFKKIISWQERFRGEQGRVNATLEKNFLAQQKANKSAKDSAMVFQKQEADLKKVARANRSLRMEFKQGHAAMVQLRAEQMRLSRAFRQGVIDADQYKVGMDRLGMAAGRTGKHMNRSGVLVQQTGYQVGDFLVQVQSGTNAMVAFGQQATQIAGTLTILGGKWILIGTVLGVTIPLLTAVGAYFMRTAKDARETSDSVETLDDKIKSLNKTVEDWLTTRRAASMGITVEELLGVQNIQSAQKAVDAARSELQDLISQTQSNAAGGYSPRAGGDRNRLAADLGDLINEQVLATKKLIDAEKLLADLERKNAQARFANFRSEAVELSAQLSVRRAIDKFGRDSAQVRAVELSNSINSHNRQIQAQVRSNDITQAQADILIRLNTELLNSEASYETMLDNQSRIKSGAETLVTVWDNLKKIVTDAANESGRFADNLVLGQGYLDAAVRSGVASGAIPPQALQDLPQTPSEKAMESILASRRAAAKARDNASGGASPTTSTNTEASLGLETYQKALKEVIALEEQRKALIEPMATAFTDSFTSIVDGTMSMEGAFKDMSRKIVAHLWEVFVVQSLINSITGMFGGGSIGSTAIPKNNPLAGMSGSQMLPDFSGGGYTGSGPRSGGMDGEGGYLAMLHPRETVVDHTKGQSSGGTTVQQTLNFNFSANGDDSVKKIIAQAAPQIAQMTQKSMMDQRRRGGSMKSTFG